MMLTTPFTSNAVSSLFQSIDIRMGRETDFGSMVPTTMVAGALLETINPFRESELTCFSIDSSGMVIWFAAATLKAAAAVGAGGPSAASTGASAASPNGNENKIQSA